jgi:hypothetical protein
LNIKGEKNKSLLINAEEKIKFQSLFIESINRMEKYTDSIELLRSCAFALQNLINESHDKESDIPTWIRD